MRKVLTQCWMITVTVAVCSCSFQQKQNAVPADEEVSKTTHKSNESDIKSFERPKSNSAVNAKSFSSSYTPNDEDGPLPVSLPGEQRGSLRTPDMPKTLPLTIEGKVNPNAQ